MCSVYLPHVLFSQPGGVVFLQLELSSSSSQVGAIAIIREQGKRSWCILAPLFLEKIALDYEDSDPKKEQPAGSGTPVVQPLEVLNWDSDTELELPGSRDTQFSNKH